MGSSSSQHANRDIVHKDNKTHAEVQTPLRQARRVSSTRVRQRGLLLDHRHPRAHRDRPRRRGLPRHRRPRPPPLATQEVVSVPRQAYVVQSFLPRPSVRRFLLAEDSHPKPNPQQWRPAILWAKHMSELPAFTTHDTGGRFWGISSSHHVKVPVEENSPAKFQTSQAAR